ncbi:MAG TPA: metallophosphoesterase family protein, partial [Chloroflexi bacterium]|nr:metallophosphoesterase family protein [Chloroflexota bacterium]
LRAVPDLWTIQGNHDDWLARSSIDTGRPDGMSEGEWAHQRWVHRQVDPELRGWVARWPRMIRREIEGVSAVFVHYGLTESGDWHAPVRHSSSADLDRLFLFEDDVTVVFFGHDHEPMDHTGRARYINPGSLGCGPHPSARWVLATFAQGRCHIERRATPYDDAPLLRALDNRDVPERDFIRRVFYHGRKGRP